jgi:hypothetical protein
MASFRIELPTIFFMHVPKTGGTAVGQWLRQQYRSRDYIYITIRKAIELLPGSIRTFRCYHSSHLGKALLHCIGHPDMPAVTMLRDPVERFISYYEQRKRRFRKMAHLYQPGYADAMLALLGNSIDDFMHLEELPKQIDILGDPTDYNAVVVEIQQQLTQGDRSCLLQPFRTVRPDPPHTDSANLGRSIAWLREMPVVGLNEQFHKSMLLLADLLGVNAPREMPIANVNPNFTGPDHTYRNRLTQDTLARIEEFLRPDQELYGHAAELFEQQWARYQRRRLRSYTLAPRLRMIRRGLRQTKENLRRR